MHLSKDEQILYNHFEDMYNTAYNRGIPIFSDFVGLNGLELCYRLLDKNKVRPDMYENKLITYGGYDGAMYQMLCFLPENNYIDIRKADFPISCIKIAPVNNKFCDKLTHRDFLGAVMNLGIERNQVGDIVVKEADSYSKASVAYVYCKSNKEKLIESITSIKHTTVYCEAVAMTEIDSTPKYREIIGSVASLRLDAVTAVALKSSRSQCLEHIRAGNVYINGRNSTENAKEIKDGDILTVRGFGKYLIETSENTTRKGRYHIIVKQYI